MTQRKEGEFYYAPHRRQWGVWKNHNHQNGISSGEFISDFPTKEQASNFVYRMNGWNLPTSGTDETEIQKE